MNQASMLARQSWRAGRWQRGSYTLVAGFVAIFALGLIAHLTNRPYMFPSLGPTAIGLFFLPLAKDACPRNVIVGHGIGALCGYGALWVTGLAYAPATFEVGVSQSRVVAAALALALTGAVMIWLQREHLPAGATTLIVALGIMPSATDVAILMAGVVVITYLALAINRLVGIPYPFWGPLPPKMRDTPAGPRR
ncbi:HPP family protein [bacterium]|nr:MAG: HPP family protein [bacterium]